MCFADGSHTNMSSNFMVVLSGALATSTMSWTPAGPNQPVVWSPSASADAGV